MIGPLLPTEGHGLAAGECARKFSGPAPFQVGTQAPVQVADDEAAARRLPCRLLLQPGGDTELWGEAFAR